MSFRNYTHEIFRICLGVNHEPSCFLYKNTLNNSPKLSFITNLQVSIHHLAH